MPTYSIQAIKYCEQTVPGPQMFFMSRWDEWLQADFFFFVLRGDDGQVILIDCGVRDVDEIQPLVVAGGGWQARFRMDMATQNVPLLLQQTGVDPAAVSYVLLSHLHYDHCSNARLFPNAKFVVSRTGWEMTLNPPHPALVPDILFPRDVIAYLAGEARDRLILVDDEAPDILPGIGAFYVGGHTMCCQAFTVPTRQGLAVFPSDTVFYYANLEQMHPIGLAVDIKQCWVAMERIRALLRAQNGFLVPPHDPELLRRHPGGVVTGT
ncbi:MAG: N-acyl homoserine lactonase family protein [Caldilineales bacterium]|nr:N-acyl homoserine lactonase family protein [Caldilineales bacterium]